MPPIAAPEAPHLDSRTIIVAHGVFGMGVGKTYQLSNNGNSCFCILKPDGDSLKKTYTYKQLIALWRQGRISINGGRIDRQAEMVAQAESKRLEKETELTKFREDRAVAYAKSPAAKWLESAMGTEFANASNRQSLARVLDGTDAAYGGLVSHKWDEPLKALGASDRLTLVSDVVAFLKEKYQASIPPTCPA